MARSTVALALLGMLAFAAVAMADDAEVQKKHHGDYNKHNNKDKDIKDRSITLTVEEVPGPQSTATGQTVGSIAVLTFNLLDSEDKPVAKGAVTGIATEISGNAFVVNGQLSIVVIDGRYKDTIITAAGPVGWDGQQIDLNMNTMVVTGGSGLLEGAEGTIVLMGADDNNKKTVTLNLRTDGKHGKN